MIMQKVDKVNMNAGSGCGREREIEDGEAARVQARDTQQELSHGLGSAWCSR